MTIIALIFCRWKLVDVPTFVVQLFLRVLLTLLFMLRCPPSQDKKRIRTLINKTNKRQVLDIIKYATETSSNFTISRPLFVFYYFFLSLCQNDYYPPYSTCCFSIFLIAPRKSARDWLYIILIAVFFHLWHSIHSVDYSINNRPVLQHTFVLEPCKTEGENKIAPKSRGIMHNLP